jgi:hypothetical protein
MADLCHVADSTNHRLDLNTNLTMGIKQENAKRNL